MRNYRLDTDKLNAAIAASGYTPIELAFHTGVTPSAIYAWRTGATTPTAIKLKALCETLGLKIDDVLIAEEKTRKAVKLAA